LYFFSKLKSVTSGLVKNVLVLQFFKIIIFPSKNFWTLKKRKKVEMNNKK
jgi:hypothetical protein